MLMRARVAPEAVRGRAVPIARTAGARRRPCSRPSAASCRRPSDERSRNAPSRTGPHELRQDVRRAEGAGGEALGCLCRPCCMLAGGSPPSRRMDRARARRARDRRGAGERVRARHLLDGRWRRTRASCSSSTRCSGPTTRSAARVTRSSRASTATSCCSALDALPLERAFPEHELKVFERKLPLACRRADTGSPPRDGCRRLAAARCSRSWGGEPAHPGRSRCSTARCRCRRAARRHSLSSRTADVRCDDVSVTA